MNRWSCRRCIGNKTAVVDEDVAVLPLVVLCRGEDGSGLGHVRNEGVARAVVVGVLIGPFRRGRQRAAAVTMVVWAWRRRVRVCFIKVAWARWDGSSLGRWT